MKIYNQAKSCGYIALFLIIFILLVISDSGAAEMRDFYITNSSARTISFLIGTPSSDKIACTIIKFDATTPDLTFGLVFNGATISPLTTASPSQPTDFNGIKKWIFYENRSKNPTEHSIIIGHRPNDAPIPIADETWTISVDGFPSITETYVNVTLQSLGIDGNEVTTPSTQFTVFPCPEITLAPDPLDFGDKIQGVTATLPITIENSGTANLHITEFPTISGSQFDFLGVLPAVPDTLKPGDTQTIQIEFFTTFPGARSGALTVRGDAKLQKTATLEGAVVGGSTIYFTNPSHNHSGIGNTPGYAALENAKDYEALMILGRAGTSKGRYVKLWDYLQVNGGIDITGNVGIGIPNPNARLSVVAADASEITGIAKSSTFITSAGLLGNAVGNELALANIGFNSGNNSSLGIRARRTANGSDWTTTAIGLGMDVDNTVRAGASLWLHSNGKIGIGIPNPSTELEVAGSIKATAGLYVQDSVIWDNGASFLSTDQSGSIELGNPLAKGTTPYIDFRYGGEKD